MATRLAEIFTEVVIAPGFEPEALNLLSQKKNVRLLELADGYVRDAVELRQVSGGMLVQVGDLLDAAGDDPSSWSLAAGEPADDATLAELAFAWRAVRAAKSNAMSRPSTCPRPETGAQCGSGMRRTTIWVARPASPG